jgi:hypothetical protein
VTWPIRLVYAVALALAALAAVVALTWALEQAIPPPYSGYLALILVGLAATQAFKRRPEQRARRMFRIYLRARERGADESAARAHLLARLYRDTDTRQRVAREIDAMWAGPSETDRVVDGVAALLARTGKAIDAHRLRTAYDRERDRFTIAGWEGLPKPFVDEVMARLDEPARGQLDGLIAKYALFRQKFFRNPTSLAVDPAASSTDFARLLHSMGNRLAAAEPGDAERAYRLSLRLRPDRNLAHAGLALLLERTGRTREAAIEARLGLGVLDDYARRAAAEEPSTEDISPFRSPTGLREALERVGGRRAVFGEDARGDGARDAP